MQKTPISKQISARLADLNDQLCFFLMLEDEFKRRLKDFGPGASAVYTTDVFVQNSYANKINVQLGKLPRFQGEHRQFSFGAYFSTSYEVASAFFDKAEVLLGATNHVLPRNAEGGPEDRYVKTLEYAEIMKPSSEIIWTISYCRYRRNSFIHFGESASQKYKDLAEARGDALNSFWGQTSVPIDFRKPTVEPLHEDESIAMIKLLRICVDELDVHLASVLDVTGVVSKLAEELFGDETVRMNSNVARERCKTLTKVLSQQYGGSASESDIDIAVRTVGIRDS